MKDLTLSLMAGIDIPIPELQLTLHPPTLQDIAFMGEEDYFQAIQYLCLEKRQFIQDESLLETITNFQVLMKILMQPEFKDKKQIILTALQLLFPDRKTLVTPNSIILINKEKESSIIDESNFPVFQNVLNQVSCTKQIFKGDNDIVYNPVNAAAKKIADKLEASRRKIAQIKSADQGSVLTRYISILVVGLNSMTLQDCLNLTVFQLFDLVDRYMLQVSWDVDLKSRLAGGKPEEQVENWMKNIH